MREISKRRRHNYRERSHGKRKDLISQLPDHLLYQILLRISTKDSVKTGVLSSRWRYLWKHVPGLDLNYTDFRYNRLKGFVNKFLDFDKKSLILQLKLNFDSEEYEIKGYHFKKWINSVVTRGVQHLVVDACSINTFDVNNCCPIKLPVSICMCETLVHLNLEYVHMCSFEQVSLPRLETLHLRGVWFKSDDDLEKFISSSQVLRVLNIEDIRNVKVLRVRSQTLNSFTICFWKSCSSNDDQTNGLLIDAPRLKCLHLSTDQIINLVLNRLCCPITMVIYIRDGLSIDVYPINSSKIETLRNFLAGISKVTNLELCSSTLKVFCAYLGHKLQHQFHNLTHLQVPFRSSLSQLLPTFLESCPNLESLYLWVHVSLDALEISRSHDVPKCLLTSLKFVNIGGIEKYPVETGLVEYFLSNAAVLRDLTLFLPCGATKNNYQTVKQILTIPRRSSACQVFIL